MKSADTAKPFPNSDAEWEALLAQADGADEPLDPQAEAEFAERAVVVKDGSFSNVRDALEKRRRGERGPQKTPVKERITIRLSADVVTHFRTTGSGWQTRIDHALQEWIAMQDTNYHPTSTKT